MLQRPAHVAEWSKQCAVERDALSGRGSRLSQGAFAYQRIISNNLYAHDGHGVNAGQGFDCEMNGAK